MESHLFGLLGHIHRSATVGLGTNSVTHNAPAAAIKKKKNKCGKSDGVRILGTGVKIGADSERRRSCGGSWRCASVRPSRLGGF